MADTAYRTADVDGLTVFYREAGAADAPRWCSCTVSRPRAISSAS